MSGGEAERMAATPEQDAYLSSHAWGILGTGRRSGAPQMSMVAYDWDGTDLVISCRGTAAKYRNATRLADVSFAVPDGVDNLDVVGTAICHDTGPERDRLTARLRDSLAAEHRWASDMLDADIAAGLDSVGRVIIQIVPTRLHLIQPLG